MGLLNEDQLNDIMSNVHVCDEDWFEELLRMWNDRQTTYQIERGNKMNDYEKTIEVLQNRVRALEQLIQPVNGVAESVKWQPKGGNFFIQSNGKVSEVVGGSDTPHKEFGVERTTQQQAERAAVEMRRFNRLLALRDELCGDEVVNWRSNDSKFHIHFHTTDKIWFVGLEFQCQFIMPYFTSQEAAQKACDMLNSGEVEL
jgi:hypothetical protein